MELLVIEEWAEEKRWAGESSWNLKAFCHRISLCTSLKGTELKRIARKLKNKELYELEVNSKETATALVHTLQSLGAKVDFK